MQQQQLQAMEQQLQQGQQPSAIESSQQPSHHHQQQPPHHQHQHHPAYVFTNAKAGMQGVDQEHVKAVVYEMSKDSAHFANEQRKQAQTDARINRLRAQAGQLSAAQLAAHQRACDAKVALLEAGRQLDKVWLHVDMDSFYASVEELEQPALKHQPMAVGGLGMICTASYEARKYGVRAAMPGFIAKRLCPQLVFVPPNFEKYTAASRQVFELFRELDAAAEGASLDECYIDATSYCQRHGMTGAQAAAQLRARVVAVTRLTCSVGVAPNKTLAKIASDRNKPDGQCVVGATRDEVMAFIQELPIRKLPGIGKVTEQVLAALGIATCADVTRHGDLVLALFSETSSSFLLRAALGLGATEHSSGGGEGPGGQQDPGRKGISCERTFGAMTAPGEMQRMAESLVEHLAADMAGERIEGKTLTLKLKTTAFEVRTRAVTLPTYVSTPAAMLPPVLRLLRAELPVSIRLMGVRASNLRKARTPLEQLASADGARLNALQRMILQGRQQQQPGQAGAQGGPPPPHQDAGEEQQLGQPGVQEEEQQQPAADLAAHSQRLQQLYEQQCSQHLAAAAAAAGDDGGGLRIDGAASEAAADDDDHAAMLGFDSDEGDGDVVMADDDGDTADAAAMQSGLQHWQQQSQQQQQDNEAAGAGWPHALALMPPPQQQRSSAMVRQTSSGAGSSSGNSTKALWACLACTFSGNHQLWLRCEVCDTPRGQPAAAAAKPAHVSGARHDVQKARGRHAGSSRQRTLESLGMQPRK